jgi:DNA-binding GntR family transcriptional regulator
MTKPSSFSQIENKPLRERVLDSLRNAIVNGELKPGEAVVETELAAQLGVSRAPLREAINVLNMEGLLETIPYHGTTVKQLSRKDIEDLYSVRSMMEVFAVRHIIEHDKTEVTVTLLRASCKAMLKAAENNDLSTLNRLDRAFHNALIESSENEMLLMLWNSVTLRVQQVMSLSNELKGDLLLIARNHQIIVDALAEADVDESTRLIDEHIRASGNSIAASWEDIINAEDDTSE